jgi:hypothetical protein
VCSRPIQGTANAALPSVFLPLKPVTYACLLIGVVPGGISSLQKVQIERFQKQ